MDMREKGMQKKMYLVIAAVAAVAIVALVLILALGRKEEAYRSIKIIELGGEVTIQREGIGVLEASSNMNLISGDAVKTEQDAYAVLQLDSDKYVMLAESGSMTVVAEGDEANSRTAIRLDSGSVLSEIQNPLSDGSSYDIVTPNATMSVRGTVFEVRKNEDDNTGNIEVLVYDGKVAVGLEGRDPALYGAGEYTQFTAGQDPQFIVERAEIAEENLNPQFMERLEQIDSQSRELNLGTAQLASARTQGEVPEPQQTPAVPEAIQTTPQTPAPSQTEATLQTPRPESKPTAVQVPVSTPKPQAGVTTPDVPTVESPVTDTEDQDEEDRKGADDPGDVQQPAGNPGNGSNAGDSGNPGNGSNAGNSGNPGNGSNAGDSGNPGNGSNAGDSGNSGNGSNVGDSGNPGNGSNAGDSGDSGNGSNAGEGGNPGNENNPGEGGNPGNESNPGESGDAGNGSNPGNGGNTGNDQGNGSWSNYDKQIFWQKYTFEDYKQAAQDSVAGTGCTVYFYIPEIVEAVEENGDGKRYSTLTQTPPSCITVQAVVGDTLTAPEVPGKAGLTFIGWCKEDRTIWDFDTDVVEADMCLYPLWTAGTSVRYFPVICRSEQQHCYYCNSVEEGSYLKETSLVIGGNPDFLGWERVLKEGGMDAVWNFDTDTVDRTESLKASWRE